MFPCKDCEGQKSHRWFCDQRELKTFAERAAVKIIYDLVGRRGMRWDDVDEDVQELIFQTWVKIIQEEVGAQ